MNMMTSAQFVFYLTCVFLGEIAQTNDLVFSMSLRQGRRFVSVNAGDSVTLHCFYEGNAVARFHWYKLILGEKPKLISTLMFETKAEFHDEFKSDPRFTVEAEKGKNHLKITKLRISDSAAYYCASSLGYQHQFAEGTIIDVKGSGLNIQTLLQQSASETIQSGGSTTLNCTVHIGICDKEHSVYWIKDSKASHTELIYTHGGNNHQCERKPNTQAKTCVYNLRMKSLNQSLAGTYYCAVVSCGHILFGNGTKVDVEDEGDFCISVYFFSGALAFTTFLSIFFATLLYVTHKRTSSKGTESHSRISPPSSSNVEGDQNEENIHYAALKHQKADRPRRQRNNNKTERVYSSIKQ